MLRVRCRWSYFDLFDIDLRFAHERRGVPRQHEHPRWYACLPASERVHMGRYALPR